MTFAPPFSRVFSPTFDRRNAGGAWWNLFGAIPTANCIAAYQPKGSSSLAASYANLVTPGTYDAAPGVAPTWDVTNGWIFDGSNDYLTTGIVPTSNSTIYLRITGAKDASEFRYLFGANATGATFVIGSNYLSKVWYFSGGNLQVSPQITSGRIGIAGNQGYRNGVADGGTISAWTGSNTNGIYIGCANAGGAPEANSYKQYKLQAISFYSIKLSAAQMAALDIAIAAL